GPVRSTRCTVVRGTATDRVPAGTDVTRTSVLPCATRPTRIASIATAAASAAKATAATLRLRRVIAHHRVERVEGEHEPHEAESDAERGTPPPRKARRERQEPGDGERRDRRQVPPLQNAPVLVQERVHRDAVEDRNVCDDGDGAAESSGPCRRRERGGPRPGDGDNYRHENARHADPDRPRRERDQQPAEAAHTRADPDVDDSRGAPRRVEVAEIVEREIRRR